MDTERLKDQSAFITHRELTRTQEKLRDELSGKIDGSNRRIDGVDDKVDNLRDIVLPLLESSKQTAENTRKMADGFERFADRTNERLNGLDVSTEGLKHIASGATEQKKIRGTIVVAIIGGVTTLIATLFALAPHLFK